MIDLVRRGSTLVLLLALASGCGKLNVLGTEWPVPYHFHVPAPVTELASPSRTDNPTLTGDLLEIYFTSNRDGGVGDGDVWVAKRTDPSAPFGTPALVDDVNTDSFETSSAISTDGLTLFYSAAPVLEPLNLDDAGRDADARPDAGSTPDAAPTLGTSDLFVAWRRSTDMPRLTASPGWDFWSRRSCPASIFDRSSTSLINPN